MTIDQTQANAVLDDLLGSSHYHATLYLALFTSNPGVTGSAAGEPSGNAYARVAITQNNTNWPAAATGAKASGAAFTFPVANPAGWSTITYAGLCVSATPGTNDVIMSGALTTPTLVTANMQPTFNVGDLTAALS